MRSAPAPAPRPPPAPVPTNTHSGNNPSGVSIAPPRPSAGTSRNAAQAQHDVTAKAIRGTPAGVAIIQPGAPTINDRHAAAAFAVEQAIAARAAKAASSGPSIGTGAIMARIGGPGNDAVGNVIGNLGKDVVNLPGNTLTGMETLGPALLHDATSVPGSKGYHSELMPVLKGMANTDPLALAVQGRFSDALKSAESHPLGAIMDAAGVGGVTGRLAGAVARTGVAGDAAAGLAGAREPLTMGDGSIALRPSSPNLFKNMALKGKDSLVDNQPASVLNAGGVNPLGILQSHLTLGGGRGAITRELARRADEHEMVAQHMATVAERHAREEAKTAGLGPVETNQAVNTAKIAARDQAIRTTVESNALEKRLHTGDVYYNQNAPLSSAAQRLNADGHKFASVPLTALGHSAPRAGESGASVMLPQQLADRMAGHVTVNAPPATVLGKGMQQFTRGFRNTVLPFSTKWILGNASEATLRGALHGVSPAGARLVNPLIDSMHGIDEGAAADRLQGYTMQGSHFAMNQRLDREMRQQAGSVAGQALPVRAAAGIGRAYNRIPEGIFKFNGGVEQKFGQAVLGKHIAQTAKDIKRANPGISKTDLQTALAHEYAKPSVQADVGRFSQHVLGKYGGYGPESRNFIRTAAPFGPWYANSAKFVGHLPTNHPLFTQANDAAQQATAAAWAKSHASVKGLGGSLLTALPQGKHGFLDIGRYGPFGAFSGGQGIKNVPNAAGADISSALFPQYSDMAHAAMGQDAFGRPLTFPGPASKLTPKGRVSTAKSHPGPTGGFDAGTFLSGLLSQELGPAQLAHRVAVDQGATPFNSEKLWNLNPVLKSGQNNASILKGLNRVFNPAYATQIDPHPAKSKSSSKRGGSGFGGGSGGGSGFGGGSSSGSGF